MKGVLDFSGSFPSIQERASDSLFCFKIAETKAYTAPAESNKAERRVKKDKDIPFLSAFERGNLNFPEMKKSLWI